MHIHIHIATLAAVLATLTPVLANDVVTLLVPVVDDAPVVVKLLGSVRLSLSPSHATRHRSNPGTGSTTARPHDLLPPRLPIIHDGVLLHPPGRLHHSAGALQLVVEIFGRRVVSAPFGCRFELLEAAR